MPEIVGIRFKTMGKIYYFSPNNIKFEEGDGAIVETSKGVEYGKVVLSNREVSDKEIIQPLKDVKRKATKDDEERIKKNQEKKDSALKIAEEKIEKHNLKMKLVDAEYTFDGNKVIFYFTADGRIDFRELVRDLASVFKIRIELRQIGIRDEAKLLGGLGPCGRPCCCSAYLGDFAHVSIKMVKKQGLSLNPNKISGLCGRLMCCLGYEDEYYDEVSKIMPKVESFVKTKDGRAQVVGNDMLRKKVKVKFEGQDGSVKFEEYDLADVKVYQTISQTLDDDIKKEASGDIKKLED